MAVIDEITRRNRSQDGIRTVNMGYAIGIAAFIVFVAIAYLTMKSRKTRTDTRSRVLNITDKRRQPSGMEIWVEAGAVVSPAEIDAIERGLKRCFDRARAAGYTRPFDLNAWQVAILGDSIKAPESGIWAMKVPLGEYAGTEWDTGVGYLMAAGQTIGVGEPLGILIALPDHPDDDMEQIGIDAETEAEHVILAWEDPDKYEATKFHGVGEGHPLF